MIKCNNQGCQNNDRVRRTEANGGREMKLAEEIEGKEVKRSKRLSKEEN